MKQLFIISCIFLYNIILWASSTVISKNSKAQLVDANYVRGVEYSCRNISGTTNNKGTFEYRTTCGIITFKIGNIILAKIDARYINHTDKKLYTTDLAGKSRTNTNNIETTNISRILQTLDNDFNYKNGIDINATTINNIINSISTSVSNSNINDKDLQNIIDDANINRVIISKICSLVHLEERLRDDGFNVDTVPPCKPTLEYNVQATSNNLTYIEINGERDTKILLNGIDSNKKLDKNGNYLEFKLNTKITINTFDDFSITLKDATNKISEALEIHIFNDSSQPKFNNFPKTITVDVGDTYVLDINVSDNSKDNNLPLSYEVLGDNKDLFKINQSNAKLYFKNSAKTGNYKIIVKAIDLTLHYNIKVLKITVP
jgi:hypothetical protein